VVPEHLRFGGGVSATVFSPVVAILLIIAGVLIWVLPQKKVIVPFLLAFILIPSDQILVVGGLHFPSLRILILFGMIRIFFIKGRGDWSLFSGGLNGIDKALILLSLVSGVAGVLLFRSSQAFAYQLGEAYTALGMYFVLRCLVRDHDDVIRVICVLSFIVVVLGGVMVFEQFTRGWNPYSLLEGAHSGAFFADMGRDGRVRATGSFSQPILAGTFAAVALPLFLGVWTTEKKHRLGAAMGAIGSIVMVIACNSSTPLMGLLAGLVGLCLWPIRSMTRLIRWSIAVVLISLQIVMKAPVYHLITRFDISGSSWHRYELIHETVLHFWEWWLIGTNNNANWGFDMWDTADQYVQTATSGGLLGLILFIAVIVYGFKYLGRARLAATGKEKALFFWALGSALLAYTVQFFGISLWDQSMVQWYILLAFISAVAAPQSLKSVQTATTGSPRGELSLVSWQRSLDPLAQRSESPVRGVRFSQRDVIKTLRR
jgi:hypothetical protein